MKKIIFFTGIGLALIAVLVLKTASRQSQQNQKYSLAKVKRADLALIVSASGKVKARTQVELKFQTSGLLAWVGVKEGDYVKKYQAIASLDKRELEKTFQKYANDYLSERADFEQTQDDYKTTRERKLVTDAVQRVLDKAQYGLNKAVLDYEIKDLAVKYATIYSPIEGIVTSVDTPVAGVNITPAGATFTIADPFSVVFSANVDEADIGRAKLGQEAKVILDAYPDEEFGGKVEKINFTAVSTAGGGTAFPVEVSLPGNENLRFRVGMNGDLEAVAEERKGVLVVPGSTIFSQGGKTYVWRVINGQARRQEVKVGLETETETEIVTGLGEGEEVVEKEAGKIREGEKINK